MTPDTPLPPVYPRWSCSSSPAGDYLILIELTPTAELTRRIFQFDIANLADPSGYCTFFISQLTSIVENYYNV